MNHHYPLFIFGAAVISLVALQQTGTPQAQNDVPEVQPKTVTNLEAPTPKAPPIDQVSRKPRPSLSGYPGIVWHIAPTIEMVEKRGMCKLIVLLEGSEPLIQFRYWNRLADGTIEILTPRQSSLSKTISAHLETTACLYHEGIKARDPVTQRRFDETTFPRQSPKDEFPLNLFFQVFKDGETTRTLGMTRLGHPELELRAKIPNAENIVWRIIAMLLTDRPLKELLRLDELLLTIVKENHTKVIIAASKRIAPKRDNDKDVRKAPRSSTRSNRTTPRRFKTVPNSQPKSLSRPAAMPEYR
jgi:hypothetical protein